MDIMENDEALARAVRAAFDAGEVPATIRTALRAAAAEEWTAARIARRQRMHRWLSGLTSVAAALVVLMYSATQYFGKPEPRADEEELRRLDRIMDLVSLSYPDEDLTDEELESMAIGPASDVSPATLAAKVDKMLSTNDGDSGLYE